MTAPDLGRILRLAEAVPTPEPFDWMAVGANASGGHHIYLIDANRRKVAAIWGRADEKAALAAFIAAVSPAVMSALIEWLWPKLSEHDLAELGLSMQPPLKIKDIEIEFPVRLKVLRRHLVNVRDQCPECGGSLDTGWECTRCKFDAKPLRMPERQPGETR